MANFRKVPTMTPNLVTENTKKLLELFPGCATESVSENGEPCTAIDFDRLRQELSSEINCVGGGHRALQLLLA